MMMTMDLSLFFSLAGNKAKYGNAAEINQN